MLELCNVNMLFRQKKIKINVLKNINLVLPNTGLVIIKGPSGVGKTTLLNIISGLKKPSKGYIKYNCEKIKNMTEFRRNHIFYAMQNDSLYNDFTLEENIKILCDDEGHDYDISKVNDFKNELNLCIPNDKKIKEMSFGEQMRSTILLALLTKKEILLFDEPTANLDRNNSLAFLNLISLIKDKKLIIVASHDDELKSDKIITLSEEKYIAFEIEKLNSNYDNKNKNLSYKRKLFSTMKRFELIPFVFGIALMLISIYIASAINNNLYENYDDPDAYVTNVRNDDAYDALKTAYENNIIEDMTVETRFCPNYFSKNTCSWLYEKYGVENDNLYPISFIKDYSIFLGRMPNDENEVVIGKKLADKIVNDSHNSISYNSLLSRNLSSNFVICGISRKETYCCYALKKQYNGLLYGKSSQNKAYGAVQYEKYDLLYGEDYDYNKSSILIVANNNYDITSENYDDIYTLFKQQYESVGIVKIKGNQTSFSYLRDKEYCIIKPEKIKFKAFNNISLCDGKVPENDDEIVVSPYLGNKIGEKLFDFKIVGFTLDDVENCYFTNKGLELANILLPIKEFLCNMNANSYNVDMKPDMQSKIILNIKDKDAFSKLLNDRNLKNDFFNYSQIELEKNNLMNKNIFLDAFNVSCILVALLIILMLLFEWLELKKNENIIKISKLKGYSNQNIIANYLFNNRYRFIIWLIIDAFICLVYLHLIEGLPLINNIFTSWYVYIIIIISFLIELLTILCPIFLRLKIMKDF